MNKNVNNIYLTGQRRSWLFIPLIMLCLAGWGLFLNQKYFNTPQFSKITTTHPTLTDILNPSETVPETIVQVITDTRDIVKTEVVYVDVPTVVDTAALIQDYFNEHVYSHQFKDNRLSINIVDTISQNRIEGRSFTYQLTPEKKKKQLWVGGSIQATFVNGFKMTQAGPMIMYTSNSRFAPAISYDFLNQSAQAGFLYSIINK